MSGRVLILVLLALAMAYWSGWFFGNSEHYELHRYDFHSTN